MVSWGVGVLLLFYSLSGRAVTSCNESWSWAAYQCRGLSDAWDNGTWDLYLTGYAYHARNTYSSAKLSELNEQSWGAGYGWSRRNAMGDNFGVYGLAFKDSHSKYTKLLGWAWWAHWPRHADVSAGIGYTAFLASRPDIWRGAPFPGVLPLATFRLYKAELIGTYIPKVSRRTTGNGNVGFVMMRYHF